MTLNDRAIAILRQNDQGGYTLPTHGLYPYQWNWDSAFAAWGFMFFDPERGWAELETLLKGQWEDGMVPHILFPVYRNAQLYQFEITIVIVFCGSHGWIDM